MGRLLVLPALDHRPQQEHQAEKENPAHTAHKDGLREREAEEGPVPRHPPAAERLAVADGTAVGAGQTGRTPLLQLEAVGHVGLCLDAVSQLGHGQARRGIVSMEGSAIGGVTARHGVTGRVQLL